MKKLTMPQLKALRRIEQMGSMEWVGRIGVGTILALQTRCYIYDVSDSEVGITVEGQKALQRHGW